MQEKITHLYAVLPEGEASTIRQVIQACKGLLRLSASQFFQELQTKGISSPVFKPLRDYLALVEGVCSQTYSVGDDITIGIGLDLTANGNRAKALFYAVDPNRNWDFPTLFSQVGKPVPALTDAQINQLLYYSLVGVSNKEGSFTGYAQELAAALGDLSSMPLEINQLIGLLSMVFNGGRGIIGTYMLKALQNMKSINNDLEPLQQIIEYSNGGHSAGLQNRRLQDGAVFHGNISDAKLDVHITWRQYQRILSSAKDTISLIGGPVKWGAPKGNDQENFRGYPSIVVFPSGSANYDEPTYFGTPKNDDMTYSMQSFGSPVFYGGDGNDTFGISFGQNFLHRKNKSQDDYIWSAYFAGGEGYDVYNISGTANYIFIYDSDSQGEIILGYVTGSCSTNLPFYLSGPIIGGQLNLCEDIFNVTFITEQDESKTLNITDSLGLNQIYVSNFKALQFGILPGGYSNNLYIDPNPFQKFSAISTTGKIIVATTLDSMKYNFVAYDINLKIINKFTINNFYTVISANFIATYSGNFYASALQSYSANDTLFGAFIDGSASTYTLNPIAVQQRINCSHTCDYFEFSYSIPLATGNIATVICIESENNAQTVACTLVSYINGMQKTIESINSANCHCLNNFTDLVGWPIHKGGFFLTYSPLGSNVSNVVLCNSDGSPYQKYTLNNIDISSVSFINDGYLMALQDKATTKLYVKMYREGKGWLSDFIISDDFILQPNTFMQTLPNDKTLFVIQGIYLFGFIVNSDNSNFAGPFGCLGNNPDISNWAMLRTQPNGDVFLFSYNFNALNSNYYLHTVFLPTAQLHQESKLIQIFQKKIQSEFSNNYHLTSSNIEREEDILSKSKILPAKNNNQSYSQNSSQFTFLAGIWDNTAKQDPDTGKPIFTYRVYDENNIEIGSAEFYAHPLLCFSEDKQRHNIIKTTGVLNDFNITDNMSVEEICQALPPTLFDKVITSASNAAIHGALRGGSNVVGFTLQSSFGVSQNVAYYLSQFVYYSGFFTMRFSAYCQQMENQDIASRCLNAVYYAAAETGQILIANVVLNTVGGWLHKASESLENNSWLLLGEAFKAGGSMMRFGIFACNAVDRGVATTTAALIVGTAAELVVEESGKYVVNRLQY